jgi:hypothetical protein
MKRADREERDKTKISVAEEPRNNKTLLLTSNFPIANFDI